MMKQILAIALAIMTVLSLAACGNVSVPETSGPSSAGTSASLPQETQAQPSFQELVLADDENCTFKIVSIEEDSIWGYTLNAYLENKTDKELMFALDNVSVNGFMCDPFWAASVTPGMKANEEIRFSSDDFSRNGISQVTDITFTLKVYDNNDFTADHLITETFTIYPLGEDAVQSFQRAPIAGELVLFDDENCTMIVTGYDPDNIWGYTVNVYLENKTDKTLMFSAEDTAVNGFMCDPFWAESVAPGKRSNTDISWTASDFEANGITEVEIIALPIRVYDAENWNLEDLIQETFTLEP